MHASEIVSCRDPCQAGGVLFHIVELRDLRGGLSKEDGHLPGGKGAERPIRLFDAVNQISGEAEYGAPPAASAQPPSGCGSTVRV